MREATTREFSHLNQGRCPVCETDEFQPGPRGGAAQNFECVGCGARFNVTIVGGQVLFAQYIGDRMTGADWTDYRRAWAPRRLFEARA